MRQERRSDSDNTADSIKTIMRLHFHRSRMIEMRIAEYARSISDQPGRAKTVNTPPNWVCLLNAL